MHVADIAIMNKPHPLPNMGHTPIIIGKLKIIIMRIVNNVSTLKSMSTQHTVNYIIIVCLHVFPWSVCVHEVLKLRGQAV